MISLNNIQNVYFLGIGGIGMSALARYFKLNGCAVSGYDKTQTPLTNTLQKEGIEIHFSPDTTKIPSNIDLVVYTPAVSTSNPEWQYILDQEFPKMKRAQVLGLISNSGTCLAVAGTHGKTTTSAILAHIFRSYFGEVNAFVGGILSNYNTNFLYGNTNQYFVVEADEFDRSFLNLTPNIAVINSVDADHLDIYGKEDSIIEGFQEFSEKIKPEGTLILNSAIDVSFKLPKEKIKTFGIETKADFEAKNIQITNGMYHFDFHHPDGMIENMSLSLPGKHNIENAIAASAIATLCKIPDEKISEAISSFAGVKRRFEIIRNQKGLIYIDDYAHHPTEISSVLNSAREMFPEKKLTVIFQPHLYTRTRDFEEDFASSLSGFDEVVLLDIYPARELPIAGVTSQNLLKKISVNKKTVLQKTEVIDYLNKDQKEVIITLGAGDIDTLVTPIKEFIQS